MRAHLPSILKLEVPVIVLLGQRDMSLTEIMALMPGSIIELPKESEEELELLVNNKAIGTGRAVKVGENFGLRLSFVGDLRGRIAALGAAVPAAGGAEAAADSAPAAGTEEMDAAAMAEAMLAGQM